MTHRVWPGIGACFVVGAAWLSSGCPSGGGAIPMRDAGPPRDAGPRLDAGTTTVDAGPSVDMDASLDASVDGDAGTSLDAATPLDAGLSSDAGRPIDASVAMDAAIPVDAGSIDAGARVDAGAASDAGPRDAGVAAPPPTIDGVVEAAEWSSASRVTNSVPTAWARNQLTSLRARLLPTGLYLAVEGGVESGTSANALVVYIDRARGTSEGVTPLASLTDGSGALDNAVTAPFTTPADVRPDLVWGTNAMSYSASGFDDRCGWRDLVRSAPSDLFWISASEAPTVCGPAACETYLPRSILDAGLGSGRPRTVAIFARLVNSDGSMASNQTLPEDMPGAPLSVSMLLTLTE